MAVLMVLCALAQGISLALGQKTQSESIQQQFVDRLENARAAASDVKKFCLSVSSVFDFPVLARNVAKALKIDVSSSQSVALENAMKTKLQTVCTQRAAGLMQQKIVLAGMRRTSSGILLVSTKTISDHSGRDVIWSLREAALGRVTALDVVMDGRSLFAEARALGQAALSQHNGDIGAVIDALER